MKIAVWLVLLFGGSTAMGQVSLEITPIGKTPKGFNRVFSKKVDVFDVTVFATRNTPDMKVLHAAHVLAQYLDNNSDGDADNERVVKALKESKGAVVMFSTEQEAEKVDVHRHIPEDVWDDMMLVALYGEETHPGGAVRGVFDATYEEVLHLITSAGYAHAYPNIFGEKPGTEIANAMDNARGGRFLRVPKTYPQRAWYTYDDRTCNYRCQITEYIYWGLTSILGAQDFPGRLEQISVEWRLNTAAKVKFGDPRLYKLLTDPRYAFPTILPDGKYTPQKEAPDGG